MGTLQISKAVRISEQLYAAKTSGIIPKKDRPKLLKLACYDVLFGANGLLMRHFSEEQNATPNDENYSKSKKKKGKKPLVYTGKLRKALQKVPASKTGTGTSIISVKVSKKKTALIIGFKHRGFTSTNKSGKSIYLGGIIQRGRLQSLTLSSGKVLNRKDAVALAKGELNLNGTKKKLADYKEKGFVKDRKGGRSWQILKKRSYDDAPIANAFSRELQKYIENKGFTK